MHSLIRLKIEHALLVRTCVGDECGREETVSVGASDSVLVIYVQTTHPRGKRVAVPIDKPWRRTD